jgi:hypothetical protein
MVQMFLIDSSKLLKYSASMEALAHDLRSAWRTLLRSRSAAGLAIGLIAIGIGLNTAVFTVLDRMVLRKIRGARARSIDTFQRVLWRTPGTSAIYYPGAAQGTERSVCWREWVDR